MKKFALLLLFTSIAFVGFSQDKSTRPSPPAQATATVGETTITIDYSQPGVKEREIFGALVPYGKVWRAGANETTTMEFSKDVKVNEMDVAAGKYGFYVIPGETTWTLILNTRIGWGSNGYKAADDVLRFDARVVKSDKLTEKLTYTLNDKGEASISWEYSTVNFTIK